LTRAQLDKIIGEEDGWLDDNDNDDYSNGSCSYDDYIKKKQYKKWKAAYSVAQAEWLQEVREEAALSRLPYHERQQLQTKEHSTKNQTLKRHRPLLDQLSTEDAH
jgi:hypothetical protein